MNPFMFWKNSIYSKGLPDVYRCIICQPPNTGKEFAHDHRNPEPVYVPIDQHLNSQIMILSNPELQDEAILKTTAKAKTFLTMNKPEYIEDVKSTVSNEKWFEKLEDAMSTYNITANRFPSCRMLSENHGDQCLISCTLLSNVTEDKDDFSIRFVWIEVPGTHARLIIPIIVRPKGNSYYAYMRIISKDNEIKEQA